ncbi:MAG TPA: discoidin domain-containing protein, partial [Thermoanaerobaculia bacterium]|nr:discoidin domain-containing protein [Thermoanaerobaculia bacterium]
SGTSTTFFIGQRGRFVRVQLEGTNHLQLAEVQVWAPVVTTRKNAAAGIVAVTQSSTSTGGTADRAVNGNVIGDWSSALSVSHTNGDANAWWEVDLGTVQPISTLELLNRRDCCSDRLQNVWLFVSDSPIPVGLANALAAPNVARWFRGPAPTVLTFDVNRSGRYVRVQLNGTNALALTEVQIWSRDLILTGLSKAVPRD